MRCEPSSFSITQLFIERNSIDESPSYQRESAVWSPEKRALFIDSIINGYDIPKIYFHDLRDFKKLKKYAVIDGKQRLNTIYEFLEDGFPLADDFTRNSESDFEDIKPGNYFKDFTENDRERFKGKILTIVLIKNAAEEDIEDLFSRLNNGEPLNSAEARNGIIGDMTNLIRTIAKDDFFIKTLKLKNKRYSYYEIAAKFLLLENTDMKGGGIYCDLKKKFLDSLVKNNKRMLPAEINGLSKRVIKNLSGLRKVFSDNDPLLNKQSVPPLYYIFIKMINLEYGHSNLNSLLKKFLSDFEVLRQENLNKNEDDRDSVLMDYSRMMQQGTNDLSGLRERALILKRYFLLENPDVRILDKKRAFTFEERYAIYINSGMKCSNCGKNFTDIKEMEADHIDQHAFGGETTLKNARSLCVECNSKLKTTKK